MTNPDPIRDFHAPTDSNWRALRALNLDTLSFGETFLGLTTEDLA